MSKKREVLMRAWVGAAVALGMKFCDVWSPDKKSVPAVLFAVSEKEAKKYIRSASRSFFGKKKL